MIPDANPARALSLATEGCGWKPMTERRPPPLPEAANGRALPLLLGGGMAVGISVPALVKAVSTYEIPGLGRGLCLGITSGTAAANLLARRLQHGDTRVRLALDALAALAPSLGPELSALHATYFVPGGKAAAQPYKPVRAFGLDAPRWLQLLTIAGNFTTVWKCKQGHESPVGINYLQKIELSQLPALYGAVPSPLSRSDPLPLGWNDPACDQDRRVRGGRVEFAGWRCFPRRSQAGGGSPRRRSGTAMASTSWARRCSRSLARTTGFGCTAYWRT